MRTNKQHLYIFQVESLSRVGVEFEFVGTFDSNGLSGNFSICSCAYVDLRAKRIQEFYRDF